MRKIYIVGHQGFIGKKVVELLPQDNLIFISIDIFHKIITNEVKFAFTPDDIMINLAWSYLDNFKSIDHITDCLPNHIRFYESVFKMGLKKVTAIGTCLEYGIQEGELDEDMPANPSLPYAIAKDSLRRYFDYKKNEIGLEFNWVRLFYIFGENQSPRTIYAQLVKAVADKQEFFDMSPGLQKRDYLHVNVVAKIIRDLALGNNAFGVVNCCSGNPITMIDFVNQRLKELSSHMKLNLGKYSYPSYEGMEFWGSIKKLNEILKEIT